MFGSTVKAYAALKPGEPLVPFTYKAPPLGEHEVRISVTHCGLCYSDVHAIDDLYNVTLYPFVPGHEVVGFVSETGPSVSRIHVGDRVGVGWQGRSCGTCEWCLNGEDQLCREVVTNGVWRPYGGFADSVAVDNRFAYPLPEDMPAEDAAVLLCAGITVYSGLSRSRRPGAQRVGIIGIGGLGHLAIQFAHAMGHHVTVFSTSAGKKDEAMSFGADEFVCTSDKGAFKGLEETFDLLLCTAHGDIPWEHLLESMRKRGKMVLVGFPNVAFNPTDLVVHELTIEGSFVGNRSTMQEMLAFAGQHHITPVIEQMPVTRVNEAIERIRQGKARYRIVLTSDWD